VCVCVCVCVRQRYQLVQPSINDRCALVDRTLRVSGERAVPGDAENEAARHREQDADVRHEVPALGVGVDERLVDEKRIVMAHERYHHIDTHTHTHRFKWFTSFSLPGQFAPVSESVNRSVIKSLPGPLVPWNFRSPERNGPGTFVLGELDLC